MKRAIPALLALALTAAVAGLGCEDKKPTTDSSRADAGAGQDKYASADPKLAKALSAAASASAASTSGPPPAGIFPAGAADRRHPKGAPTTVDVITDGSEPRIDLRAGGDASADAARATSYGPVALELAQQMGQRVATPTIDFGMLLGPGAKDTGSDWLVATIKSAAPAREQRAQLPPGMDKEIAAIAGSEIRVKLSADGKESEVISSLAKAAKPDLDRIVQNAAEALVFATVAVPPRPVGVGGQWIAETRMPMGGVDVVAYRAFRVKSVTGDRLHLTVDVKAYATDKDAQFPGLPKGSTFEQFDAVAQGEMELVRGETLARKSDLRQQVVLIFMPAGAAERQAPGQQPQMIPIQLSSQITLVRGDDLKQLAKP